MRQTSFPFLQKISSEFGGSLLLNKRKSKRPLSVKKPIHLVLKSSHRDLFSPRNKRLHSLILSQSKKFNIKVYAFALNHSHIHLLIKLQQTEDYMKFVRSFTSILAQKIRLLRPELTEIFSLRPYTRIISWGRQFKATLKYIVINQLESLGLLSCEKKKKAAPAKKSKKGAESPGEPPVEPGHAY